MRSRTTGRIRTALKTARGPRKSAKPARAANRAAQVDTLPDRTIIDPEAQFGRNVRVGPFSLIEGDVVVGDDCEIGPRVVLRAGTDIGKGCRLGPGVVIGEPPMDSAYQGEKTGVHIGPDNDIREYVTVHRATGPGAVTEIGSHNLVMPYVHIAHNCRIGNHVIITNACQLAGYVEVQDYANLGGMTGVHQNVRIGTYAMVGACSYLTKDMPPYLLGAGGQYLVRGINRVGLKRAGFSNETLQMLNKMYRVIYRSNRNLAEAVIELKRRFPGSPEVACLIAFVQASVRGVELRSADRRGPHPAWTTFAPRPPSPDEQ